MMDDEFKKHMEDKLKTQELEQFCRGSKGTSPGLQKTVDEAWAPLNHQSDTNQTTEMTT